MKKIIHMIRILLLLGSQGSLAATYYVATNGNNGNSGLSLNSPWRTINFAAGKAVAGDVVYLRGGVYSEIVFIGNSGTATGPIRIMAYQQESPIIDGSSLNPAQWTANLQLNGNYIEVSGLEVRNANWSHAMGVVLYGHHNKISSMNIHHIQESGVSARGDYSVVEYCRVWEAARLNCRASGCPTSPYPNGGWASGLSSCRDPQDGITDNAVLRGNIVYNNWGEGLSTFESRGTVLEDNIIYNNWATNTYISDARNIIFQRNMVYVTSTNGYGNAALFTIADEVASKPRSQDNTVINNLFYGKNVDIFSWTLVAGSGLTNTLIAHNTFINSEMRTGNTNSGSRIMNNIFDYGASVPSKSGLTFSNNAWTNAPPANAVGPGDKIGNPVLAKTGSITPGGLTADFFKVLATSIAIDGAASLSEVSDDYFKTVRGASRDIGAHEFNSGSAAPNSSYCNSPQAPVIDGIAENLWTAIKTDTLKKIIIGSAASPEDLTANFKAFWDNSALYLLIDVKDDSLNNDSGTSPWADDAVELFLDGNNEKATTYDSNDRQYFFRWNDNNVYEYRNGALQTTNPPGVNHAFGVQAGGYWCEVKLLWSAIGTTPVNGKRVGFDIHVNDDDDGNARDAKITWIAAADVSSGNPSAFGTILLDSLSCGGISTGLERSEKRNNISLYPNPARNDFNIIISAEMSLKDAEFIIYNVYGKEVKTIPINQFETTINIEGIESGIYFYSMKHGIEQMVKGKLIIQ
jgi:hypothetical protein